MTEADPKSAVEDAPPRRPSIFHVLFSFYGRIGRAQYWLGLLIVLLLLVATLAAAAQFMNPTGAAPSAGLALPLFILALWVLGAITVKRMRHAGCSAIATGLYAVAPLALLIPSLELIEAAGFVIGPALFFLLVFPGLYAGTPKAEPTGSPP